MGDPISPNFQFLAKPHPLLALLAARAEHHLFDDPNTSLFKLRQFAELLAWHACANLGIAISAVDDLIRVKGMLRNRGEATPDITDLFHAIRKTGNSAAQEGPGHNRKPCTISAWQDNWRFGLIGRSRT